MAQVKNFARAEGQLSQVRPSERQVWSAATSRAFLKALTSQRTPKLITQFAGSIIYLVASTWGYAPGFMLSPVPQAKGNLAFVGSKKTAFESLKAGERSQYHLRKQVDQCSS